MAARVEIRPSSSFAPISTSYGGRVSVRARSARVSVMRALFGYSQAKRLVLVRTCFQTSLNRLTSLRKEMHLLPARQSLLRIGEFCRQEYFMISSVNWKYSVGKSPITRHVLCYVESVGCV